MTANFEIIQGDDITLNITAQKTNGTVLSLLGVSIIFVVYDCTRATEVKRYETGDGVTITDATAGKFSVDMPAADTNELCGEYLFEAQITDSNDKTLTLRDYDLSIPKMMVHKDLISN